MNQILSTTQKKQRYTISVDYMPDNAAVQCVTIRNQGMSSRRLGALVAAIDAEYQPLKFVIVNEAENPAEKVKSE